MENLPKIALGAWAARTQQHVWNKNGSYSEKEV